MKTTQIVDPFEYRKRPKRIDISERCFKQLNHLKKKEGRSYSQMIEKLIDLWLRIDLASDLSIDKAVELSVKHKLHERNDASLEDLYDTVDLTDNKDPV